MDVVQADTEPCTKWRIIEFEGHSFYIPDVDDTSSYEPPKPQDNVLPQYSDGTFFPPNFLQHETVVGYPTDRFPLNDGVDDVLDVISLFETESVHCCIFNEMALQYYGSERLRNDWCICIPTCSLLTASRLLEDRPAKYMPFAPDCRIADRPESKYPRFKLRSIRLFILLVPAEEVRFAIDDKDSIVRGKTGLPFPSLPAFVQSLLDSKNMLDLADLIDAMNLNEEWATENGVKLSDQLYPGAQKSPRATWERYTRTRQSRMGWKYDPKIYATRYRKHRERDPRQTGDL